MWQCNYMSHYIDFLGSQIHTCIQNCLYSAKHAKSQNSLYAMRKMPSHRYSLSVHVKAKLDFVASKGGIKDILTADHNRRDLPSNPQSSALWHLLLLRYVKYLFLNTGSLLFRNLVTSIQLSSQAGGHNQKCSNPSRATPVLTQNCPSKKCPPYWLWAIYEGC